MQQKPQTGITGKARDTLAKILDHVLQDECSLSATTREYRWKITGPNLYSLHRLFDEQRRQLDYWLDQVSQVARSAGFRAHDRAEVATAAPESAASPGGALPPGKMIGDLLARHEAMARRLRADIGRLCDPATAELLKRLAEFHETTAWMLRMLHNGPGSEQPA